MRSPILCAFALLLSAPACAQDLEDDYVAVARAFFIGEGETGARFAAKVVSADLETLEGTWLDATHLFEPDDGIDAGYLAEACGSDTVRLTIQQTSPLGFATTSIHPVTSRPLAVRYQYLGFRSFQRVTDDKELREFIGLPEDSGVMADLYASPFWSGTVELFHPAPDILVLQPTAAAPEIWFRCPA